MGEVLEVKMAKPSSEDFRRVHEFFDGLESMLEDRCDIETGDQVDDAAILEWIRTRWAVRGPGVGSSWRRVVWGGQMMVDAACDPNSGVVDWRPEIAEALKAAGLEA